MLAVSSLLVLDSVSTCVESSDSGTLIRVFRLSGDVTVPLSSLVSSFSGDSVESVPSDSSLSDYGPSRAASAEY